MMLSGCAAVDASFAPRTDQVTHDVGDQRDNNTFLNIVRASRFDTLNFTTLSKYTAGGSLTLSSNVFQRSLGVNALAPADTFGPISPSGTVSSSFDLGSLENHDFYQGILSEIDPTQIDFLLHSGLTRELVLQATIASTKIVLTDHREYTLYNDPENDHWTETGNNQVNHSPSCESFDLKGKLDPLFLKPPHLNDCQYHRFLRSLYQALRYGLTTEALDMPSAAAKPDKSTTPASPQIAICFDPSIADPDVKPGSYGPRCGDKHRKPTKVLMLQGDPPIASLQPNFRSTFGIFRYLGDIIRKHDDVRLIHFDKPPQMFTYQSNGTGCFVKADEFCIPNEDSQYSKELLTLLNALIALSIKPSALPITPSVQLIP